MSQSSAVSSCPLPQKSGLKPGRAGSLSTTNGADEDENENRGEDEDEIENENGNEEEDASWTRQSVVHASRLFRLPSSHSSPCSARPLPQTTREIYAGLLLIADDKEYTSGGQCPSVMQMPPLEQSVPGRQKVTVGADDRGGGGQKPLERQSTPPGQ